MEETAVLEKFSYSLGMTYRIITDNENGKTPFELNDSIKFVKHFTDEAKDAVSSFKDSIYKKSLFKLIEYFSYNGTRLKSRNQMLEVRSQV
jgi:plasmid replication initiation protein